jgi:hypothetical protein
VLILWIVTYWELRSSLNKSTFLTWLTETCTISSFTEILSVVLHDLMVYIREIIVVPRKTFWHYFCNDITIEVCLLWLRFDLCKRGTWLAEALSICDISICISVVLHDLVVCIQDIWCPLWVMGIAIEVCLVWVYLVV